LFADAGSRKKAKVKSKKSSIPKLFPFSFLLFTWQKHR
jgi:hypothetical protein